MTLIEFTVFVLFLWAIREIIIGFWTGHRNRKLRKLIRIERTQQHFAEARNDLMRLALNREIDTRSETFGSLYKINTFVMRCPDVYPEISALLQHLFLTTPTKSEGLPEESKHWSPSIRRVVKETADAMDYIILEYSRVFRFLYWINRKADPTITPIRLLRRAARGLEERENKRHPIVSEIRETQRKMHSLSTSPTKRREIKEESSMSAKLSWEPRHYLGKRGQGAIYCSPACGAACTKAAYDEAVRASAECAKQMGPQWKPRVWENMGWHWSIESGPISIHYSNYGTTHYNCLISDRDLPGGLAAWTPQDTNGKSPRTALRKALAGVRAYRDHIVEAAERAEKAAK